MTVFLSTFVNKLDKKGRVSVPAPFRLALDKQVFQGVVVFPSYRLSAIEACGYDVMERLAQSTSDLDLFSEDRADVEAVVFANSEALSFDGEGRVLLPAALLAHGCIEDKVAFVGNGSTFQIWNPELFQAHQAEARQRLNAKGVSISLKKMGEMSHRV